MKKITLLVLMMLTVFLYNCSGDDTTQTDEPEVIVPEVILPQLTTQNPEFIIGGIKFIGNVTNEGNGYMERGFCWSYNTNPTTSNEKMTVDGSGAGTYFGLAGYFGILNTNATFNVRSYVVTFTGETVYGNNITFTTPDTYVTTVSTVTDILSNMARLSGNIVSNTFDSTISHKGFCVSTNSMPTLTNSSLVEVSGTGLGDFTATVNGLEKNTTYFVRAYGYNSTNHVIYSGVVNFKSAGYVGQSGGYVFYDKGFTSDNWRYLEASPVNLTYNNSTLIKWGCASASIFQTSENLGAGFENTLRIVQFCTDANSAARVCSNYTVNGINDWYLPSRLEMDHMGQSLDAFVQLGTSVDQTYWTSTESDASGAYVYNAYYGFAPGFGVSKNNNNLVRAVRRF